MKKQLILLPISLIIAIWSFGQTKQDTIPIYNGLSSYTSNWVMNYIYSGDRKYPDTLKCLFREWSDEILLDKWTSGFIVLKDGMIQSKHVRWSPEYAPMALGFFDNIFLYDDKHPIKNKVLQLIIY